MKPRRNKFNAKKTVLNGITFDSQREAQRFCDLLLLQGQGLITNLERQPSFPFVIDGKPVLMKSKGFPNGRKAKYVADFVYFDTKTGKRVVEDSKGFKTDIYKLKKALVECIYNVQIVEI